MEQKIQIDSIDTAKFVCPECHKEKIMQLSQYTITRKNTKVQCKCKCGFSYIAVLTKNMEVIKETRLLGTFSSSEKAKLNGKLIIKKLNNKGLMLKTNTEHSFYQGLKILLEFVLDDAKQSIVKKEVVVKAKKGKYLSAEFITQEHDDNLGPYLSLHKINV
jgi:predicted RNA-binding Zn-ribbon protein involved in translation (DUF1610 family)